MIIPLDNENSEIAKKIREIFQISYAVEAKLLNATNFPPLKRPIEGFIESNNTFFGFVKTEQIAGVIEIDPSKYVHIQSLVVDPKFFRKGIARKLLEFIFANYDSKLFTVETGAKNTPANKLYQRFGFEEVKEWQAEFGIWKKRFELRMNG